MTFSIYFDDDFVKHSRAPDLRAAGFDVVIPRDVGTSGASDPVHLATATGLGRVLVSHNIDDFYRLHTERMMAGIDHAGIILVHQNLRLTPAEIVRRCKSLDELFAGFGFGNHLLFLSNFG